jgi:hypothetical protein
MHPSLRLSWTGLSVLALGVLSCSSSTTTHNGEDGGKTDGATDGAKKDGASSDTKKDGPVDVGSLDLNGVPPPAMLTATILDRRATTFELIWTAPSVNGAAATGYQVRYAKVPITTTNFDDTTVTTAVTYTGTPKAPGDTDGTIVKAYIENGYYFAVEGADSSGAQASSFMATSAAVTAHFNVTTIPSTSGTSERFGFSVSGDGDLNGDGLSDILVGTSGGGKAYLFFGSHNFGVTSPAVTFTGATTGYGSTVAQIGDIDGDGLPDIAISDTTSEEVFIYKGRPTWPMTLTDIQADYVISTDATYASSFFGFSLARLGDFTGDGVDDLAIGVVSYASSVGRVVIIPGKASGFANVSLPDATKSIVIDGDATLGRSEFGYRVLGLGHFYSVSSGTTLLVSAPSGASSIPPNVGHVYAFHGQTGTAGVIPIASADSVKAGLVNGSQIGIVLTNLGTMLDGFPGVGIGNTQDTVDVTGANGTGYLTSGTPATGPFVNTLMTYLAGVSSGGGIILGGGISGRDVDLSLIGDDATPDLIFGGQVGSILTISDGAHIGAKTTPIELASTAEVQIALPSGWGSGEAAGSMVSDINGDGVPDFCLGSLANPGAVLVYW